MAASESKLGALHALVEQVLTDRLMAENEGLDDGLIPHASTLNAAIVFLKHNEITCAPDEAKGASDFEKLVRERKAKQVAAMQHTDLEH